VNNKQKFFIWVSAIVTVFLLIFILWQSLHNKEVISQITPQPDQTETIIPSPFSTTPSQINTPGSGVTPENTSTQKSVTASETPVPSQEALEFFVAPDGSDQGDGSKEHPWSLQYALDQPDGLKPGDTIWLLGGKYTGTFTSSIKGEEGKPVVVRAFPGERVILQNDGLVLDIASSKYVYFWGLEITATSNNRDPYNRPEGAYGIRINQGKKSDHIKFINMIIHDMPAQGIGWWQANKDSEVYGSLIFYNGVNQFDHGMYIHNDSGTKNITDNIIFDNASHGIHAYGGDKQNINNISIEGNTVFNNGSIGYSTTLKSYGVYKRNILVGGKEVAENPVIINNYTYYPGDQGTAINLGYDAGSSQAVVENNYFAGGRIEVTGQNDGMQMEKNSIVGIGITSMENMPFAGNEIMFKSGDKKIFVRPNQFEKGRANITIYNWAHQDVVQLTSNDLSSISLKKGDKYQIHNVQDYFVDVVSGVYDGNAISVPMTGHTVAQPLGLNFKPASTFPEFGAFVLFVETADNH
jgi:hypothetical protein